MEGPLIIIVIALAALLLNRPAPAEPRIIQIALDPEPPARIGSGTILICLLGALVLLALLGGL